MYNNDYYIFGSVIDSMKTKLITDTILVQLLNTASNASSNSIDDEHPHHSQGSVI